MQILQKLAKQIFFTPEQEQILIDCICYVLIYCLITWSLTITINLLFNSSFMNHLKYQQVVLSMELISAHSL